MNAKLLFYHLPKKTTLFWWYPDPRNWIFAAFHYNMLIYKSDWTQYLKPLCMWAPNASGSLPSGITEKNRQVCLEGREGWVGGICVGCLKWGWLWVSDMWMWRLDVCVGCWINHGVYSLCVSMTAALLNCSVFLRALSWGFTMFIYKPNTDWHTKGHLWHRA